MASGFIGEVSWSPMHAQVEAWGEFPNVSPYPALGAVSGGALGLESLRCPQCRGGLTYKTLQDLACPRCEAFQDEGRPEVLSYWEASRRQSVAVALVTLLSGCGVVLLALFAWGGRSQLDAALIPVPAPSLWTDAWSSFAQEKGDDWHSLPVHAELASTAFMPLPLSWERLGREGALVWIYHKDPAEGFLARFLTEDGQRLKRLLEKGGALKLTVRAKRHRQAESGLVDIEKVEKLGWGRGHRDFQVASQFLSPVGSLPVDAWLGGAAEMESLVGMAAETDL